MRKDVRSKIVNNLERFYKGIAMKKHILNQKHMNSREQLGELSNLQRSNACLAVKSSQLIIDFDADIEATQKFIKDNPTKDFVQNLQNSFMVHPYDPRYKM